MESVAFIQWCLDHLNYWTITLLMAIESSFIPFPSEVVVPPAAYKAAGGNSDLNVFLVVIFATIGANIGAIINYYIAYFVGRPLVYKFANSRFGHMCLIDEAKVQNAEHYFDKHGALSTFIGRLIPAVRQLLHSCRSGQDEIIHFPAVHNAGSRYLECHPGSHRLLSAISGSRRAVIEYRHRIQPRVRILLYSYRRFNSRFPNL